MDKKKEMMLNCYQQPSDDKDQKISWNGKKKKEEPRTLPAASK